MRKLIAVVTLTAVPMLAPAKELEITCGAGCQDDFESMAEDLVAAVDYKAAGPAEATGIAGFGIGLVATAVPVDEDDWEDVTGEDFSTIPVVGLQVTKGLPFGLDAGVFYTKVPGTDAEVIGGELRYAILEGSTVSPALALRASYSKLDGVDSFDMDSTAFDISLSKGFTLITPYVGVGYVMGEVDPDSATGLDKEDVEEAKAYIGARISLGLIEFTPELGQVGDVVTYSLRTGFSFSL